MNRVDSESYLNTLISITSSFATRRIITKKSCEYSFIDAKTVALMIIDYAPGGGVSLQLVMFEMVYECL